VHHIDDGSIDDSFHREAAEMQDYVIMIITNYGTYGCIRVY
jgi:hypothetical protein